jgi:hypothetical protein
LATLHRNKAPVCLAEALSLSRAADYSAAIHSHKVQDYLDKALSNSLNSLNSNLVVCSAGLGKIGSNSNSNKGEDCLVEIHNHKEQAYSDKVPSSSPNNKAVACLVAVGLGRHLSKAVGFLVGVDLEALNSNLSNSKVAACSVRARAHNNCKFLGKRNNNNSSSQLYSLGRATKGHSLVLHKLPLHYGRKGGV